MSKRCDDSEGVGELSHWLNLLRNGHDIDLELERKPYECLTPELCFVRDVSIWTKLKKKAKESADIGRQLVEFENNVLKSGDKNHSSIAYDLLRHHINLRTHSYLEALNNLLTALKRIEAIGDRCNDNDRQELSDLINVNKLGCQAFIRILESCPILLRSQHANINDAECVENVKTNSSTNLEETRFNAAINCLLTNADTEANDSTNGVAATIQGIEALNSSILHEISKCIQSNFQDSQCVAQWMQTKCEEIKTTAQHLVSTECDKSSDIPNYLGCIALLRQNLYALLLQLGVNSNLQKIQTQKISKAALRENPWPAFDQSHWKIRNDEIQWHTNTSTEPVKRSNLLPIPLEIRILCNKLFDKASIHPDREIIRAINQNLPSHVEPHFTAWYIKAVKQYYKGQMSDSVNSLIQAACTAVSCDANEYALCPLLNGFLKFILACSSQNRRLKNSICKWPIELHTKIGDGKTLKWLAASVSREILTNEAACKRWYGAFTTIEANGTFAQDDVLQDAIQECLLRLGIVAGMQTPVEPRTQHSKIQSRFSLIQECRLACSSQSIDILSEFNGSHSMKLNPDVFIIDPERVEESLDWAKICRLSMQITNVTRRDTLRGVGSRKRRRKTRTARRPANFSEGFDPSQLDPNRWMKKERIRRSRTNAKGKCQKAKSTSGIGFQGAAVAGDIECSIPAGKARPSRPDKNLHKRQNKRPGRRR